MKFVSGEKREVAVGRALDLVDHAVSAVQSASSRRSSEEPAQPAGRSADSSSDAG